MIKHNQITQKATAKSTIVNENVALTRKCTPELSVWKNQGSPEQHYPVTLITSHVFQAFRYDNQIFFHHIVSECIDALSLSEKHEVERGSTSLQLSLPGVKA